MPVRFDPAVSQAEYDSFVLAQPQCNLLQSPGWAKVKSGWEHTLTGLRDADGELVATGLVLRRRLPFGLSFWYVPHGPILNFDAPGILETYVRELGAYAKKSRAVAVRIDPLVPVRKAPLEELPEERDQAALAVVERLKSEKYRHRGFTMSFSESLQPRHIPVTFAPHADFQASLPKRSRTMANNARNRHVEVVHGGSELLDDFLDVIAETEKEKEINLRSRPYYQRILTTYGEDARIYLARLDIADSLAKCRAELAKYEAELAAAAPNAKKKMNRLSDQIANTARRIENLEERQAIDGDDVTLAGVLMVRYGRSAEMLYAGTNRNYGNIPAQHLMWVEALSDGFEAGLNSVSLGGVDGSLDDSLMRFKSRFNPVIFEKVGEFQYAICPPIAAAIDWYLGRR